MDPLSAITHYGVAQVYAHSGRYDEAIAEVWIAAQMDTTYGFLWWPLGLAYLQKGLHEEAIQIFQEGKNDWYLGRTYAAVAGRQEAQKTLGELKAEDPAGYAPGIAMIYAGLGEREQALDWLERAYRERHGMLIHLRIEPAYASLHGEPRFQALLEKVGLE